MAPRLQGVAATRGVSNRLASSKATNYANIHTPPHLLSPHVDRSERLLTLSKADAGAKPRSGANHLHTPASELLSESA